MSYPYNDQNHFPLSSQHAQPSFGFTSQNGTYPRQPPVKSLDQRITALEAAAAKKQGSWISWAGKRTKRKRKNRKSRRS